MRCAACWSPPALVVFLLVLPGIWGGGVPLSAQQANQPEPSAVDESVVEQAAAAPDLTNVMAISPGVPWPLTVLSGLIVVVLLALLLYRLFKISSDGVSRGIDEIRPRVLIGGMVAVLLLYGFFVTLHQLLGMLPRDNSAADRIPGEYWLFIGQALGILGSLALTVATYYFGSSSSGEDPERPNGSGSRGGSSSSGRREPKSNGPSAGGSRSADTGAPANDADGGAGGSADRGAKSNGPSAGGSRSG